MKTLHYSIIAVSVFFTLFVTSPAYAPCAIVNGIPECAGPPQLLDSVKTDKPNYENSEKPVIAITGVPFTLVHLEIDDSSGSVVFSHDLGNLTNGTLYYNLDISSYKPSAYGVTATSPVSKVTTSFTVGLKPTGGHINLNIAKNSYFPGDTVAIFGMYTPNTIISLSLTDPDGIVVKSIHSVSDISGHFSSSDISVPITAIPGIWKISATSGVFHSNIGIKIISSLMIGTTNDVDISNIQIQPSIIKVGDRFSITATLVNNSPFSTGVEIDPCGEPFPTHFDNHVKVEYVTNYTCPLYILEEKMSPGKNMTQT
ncbi:MAG: hypothetical protein ACYDAJ_11845 [Nitrosotalea sp.]